MRPASLLRLMAFACAAWLAALPAAAEEEKHPENSRSRPAAPGGNSVRTPPAAGTNSGPAAAPQAPKNSGHRPDDSLNIGSLIGDIFFGSNSSSDSDTHSYSYRGSISSSSFLSITALYANLHDKGYAPYVAAELGRSTAYYPSNFNSDFSFKVFAGARTRYFGAEIGFSSLSSILTTINSQPAYISTEAYSLAFLGYIPLKSNADFFVKYGGFNWNVNATIATTGNSTPVQSGFSRLGGFGVEYRNSSDEFFLRVEKEFYREIYQSKFYTFTGASLGVYFD
ncbi:MAG TPA: hypothetical protein VIU46_00420 [Gallionellaceae bacterium]